MADRILTFQQSSLLRDIEDLLDHMKKGSPDEVVTDIWLGIVDVVELELDRYPKELHPKVFFSGRTVYVRKGRRSLVRAYLHRLHKFIDSKTSRRLSR